MTHHPSELAPRDRALALAMLPTPVIHDPFDVSWRERAVVLCAMIGASLGALVLGLAYAHAATIELLGLIPASIVAIGKFLPLWGLTSPHFSPWDLGLVIWVLDTATVLGVVYGLALLYRIRPLKRALGRVQSHAALVLAAYPRIRRAAVAGVLLFVLFPLAGTGALVGSFLGILLGLNRGVLIAAVSAGGLAGGMLMAFAAVNFGEAVQRLRMMQSDPLIKWLIISAVAAALVALFVWVNRVYKRAIVEAGKALESP